MIERSRTFVGSSSEGCSVAKELAGRLADVTECVVWTDGVFLPGSTFIEGLEKVLNEVDFAILVASPDDVLLKREVESFTMRDNVLLELGMFMAKLGRRRTYLVTPEGQSLHIPSDLLGVRLVTCKWPGGREATPAPTAIEEACQVVRLAMREVGRELSLARKRETIKRLLVWTTRVNQLLTTLQAQSLSSLLEREQFESFKKRVIDQVQGMTQEGAGDAENLGVSTQYHQIGATLVGSIDALPFPEEAVVTKKDVFVGVVDHLFGKAPAEQQVRQRIDGLMARYNKWWMESCSHISSDVLGLQSALIALLC